MTNAHRWPIRQFFDLPSCGAVIEPNGHDEAGDPLYDFYDSESLENRVLTESEVEAEIDRLEAAKPNRIQKWS